MPAPARIEVLPSFHGSHATPACGATLFLSIGVGAVPFGRIGPTSAGLSRSLFSGWVSTSYLAPKLIMMFGWIRQLSSAYPEIRVLRWELSGVPGMRWPFLLPSVVLMNAWFAMSAGFRDAGEKTLKEGKPLTKLVTRTR